MSLRRNETLKKLLVFLAAAAWLSFALPAGAVDWNFYGSARMATFWVHQDYGDGEKSLANGQAVSDDDDLRWDFQTNSRIGAKVKHEGPVEGQFELGLKGNSSGDVDVGTRKLFGVWNFGPGKLKVGKDYTPVTQFISGQVFDNDLALQGYGVIWGDRMPQIALTFGGFEIAFVTPKSQDIIDPTLPANGTATGATGGDIDEWFPKVEAKYSMTMDAFNWAIRGGFQAYTIDDVVKTNGSTTDIDVTSWIIGADAGFNFGPAYVKGAVSYGQNVGDADWNVKVTTGTQGGFAEWDGNDGTNDVDTFMASLVAGFKMSDMLTFEAGAGYRNDDCGDFSNGYDDDNDLFAIYGQAVVTLAKGVYVIPEVGYYDYMNSNVKNLYGPGENYEGYQWYAGAKWQIDF
jgi:hypothetical protein